MTTPRTKRRLAGLGAAIVTIGIIAAVAAGYNAWQDASSTADQTGDGVSTMEPAEPSDEAEPTEQAPPSESSPEESPSEEEEHEQSSDADKSNSDKQTKESDNTEPPAWRPILNGFAADFNQVRGSGKKAVKQWRADIARWVTPHLAKSYKTTDPRLLPNTEVKSIDLQSQGSESVTAVIHYRGVEPVWVHVQPTPDGWRVTEAEPYTGS